MIRDKLRVFAAVACDARGKQRGCIDLVGLDDRIMTRTTRHRHVAVVALMIRERKSKLVVWDVRERRTRQTCVASVVIGMAGSAVSRVR